MAASLATERFVTINQVRSPGGPEMYVALVPPGAPRGAGLLQEQVIGKLLSAALDANGRPNLTPENFARNAVFVDFMHDVIRRNAQLDPTIVECARQGRPVAIVDLRSPSTGNEPPAEEDIVGIFRAKDGKLSTYEANPGHRILSQAGFFQLPPPFQEALLRELALRMVGKRGKA